ncbi:MAG TPA: glycosyltransferase [Candidatus Stackebrandtia excrementipullorum]|nr:glycosyltransferase [Candidatus Stackebrandtia excrementipullorum]
MSRPDISVIVAAYNAMPYIRRCIDSVVAQSMPSDGYEVIVVDDGSTDGTAEYLDDRADDVRVLHQENSGGPAAPRNRGLEIAHGEYVFFLDADDYLGEETLERMLAMARANDSDIVLGKMIGVGGRVVPKSMFQRDQPRTTVFDSRVYWALNPLKLFRRALIDRLHLRFDENLPVGQDQPFVAEAYLNATVISVLASYDCYYARLRDDGGNNTQRAGGATRRLPMLRTMFSLIPEAVPPGRRRDLLLRRHFQSEQREFLEHLDRETDLDRRGAAFDEFAGFVRTWCAPSVYERLPAADRLRLELIRRGNAEAAIAMMRFQLEDRPWDVVTRDGRAYATYPGFGGDVDDAFFDVTDRLTVRHEIDDARWTSHVFAFSGTVDIDRLDDPDGVIQAVLVERGSAVEHALTTETTAGRRFRVDVDPRGLDGLIGVGQWDVFLDVTCRGVTRRARVGSSRGPTVTLSDAVRLVQARGGGPIRHLEAYFTKPYGNLSFDVGMRRGRTPIAVHLTPSSQRGAVRLTGEVPGVGFARDAVRVVARRGDREVILPTACSPTGRFETSVAVPPGRWRLEVSLPECASAPEITAAVPVWRATSWRDIPPRRVGLSARASTPMMEVSVITPGRIVRLLRRRLDPGR